MHRTYENEDIAVLWNSDKCFHSRKCVEGCPNAFNPTRRPWINLSGAETKEIWQAVSRCPSGALSVVYKHDVEVVLKAEEHRSIALLGDKEIGECDYQVTADGYNIFHTGVSREYEGKGIARRLVYKVIEEAEKHSVNVTASCSYAVKVLSETAR